MSLECSILEKVTICQICWQLIPG